MDTLFGELRWTACLVYLDDIIIPAKDFVEHQENLTRILTIIRHAGAKLKLSKCSFGMASVRYLGHVVSQAGVHPDPDKLKAVRDYPTPTDVRAVRAFVGLCGYYRQFVKNFGSIARPLTNLRTV